MLKRTNGQYSRRNNLELFGIPTNISQEKLEDSVIQILRSIEVEAKPEDIEACHNGKNENKDQPKMTIVKFVNRKICNSSMKNRKKLKDTDKTELGFNEETPIFINHNLMYVGRMYAIRCGRCLAGGRGCLLKGPHLIPSLKFRLPYLINVHQSIDPFLLKSRGMQYCPSGKTPTS